MHGQHATGCVWPSKGVWYGRLGGTDASGSGTRYGSQEAAMAALIAADEVRFVAMLSDAARCELRSAGLLP